MSYLEFVPFASQQDAPTVVLADLTLFNLESHYALIQNNNNSQFPQTIIDPALEFGGMLDADFTAYSWANPPNLTQYPSLAQQNSSEAQVVANPVTSAVTTALLDPIAQPLQHSTAFYQPAGQDG